MLLFLFSTYIIMGNIISKTEASKVFRISIYTLNSLISDSVLSVFHIKGRKTGLISEKELIDYIINNKDKVSAETYLLVS